MVDLCLILILFSCEVIHRHLPSFPTRRSSDLKPSPATPEPEAPAKPANGGRRRTVFLIMGVILLALIGIGVRRWMLDRKSTRLNSSHVAMSYAVLCLKKKREVETYSKRICTVP